MPHQVDYSDHFTLLYDSLPEPEKDLIDAFIFEFIERGFKGKFPGKLARTDNVPHSDPDREKKIWFAKRYHLWHVHVGHPRWNSCKNPMASYLTSDWVVHFQRLSDAHIALVDYNSHSPMAQPSRRSLFKN